MFLPGKEGAHMVNLIVGLMIAAMVGGAGLYIYREKKRGAACVGCPHAAACAKARRQGASCCGEGKS